MTEVGAIVGEGRTSTVYAYGSGSVVKVPKPHIPAGWVEVEAGFASAVASVGAPAPAVLGLVEVDGRPSVVFERIDGELMWDRMIHHPAERAGLMAEFAELQRQIHSLPLPAGIPDAVARMRAKIAEVGPLDATEHAEALRLLNALPRGAAVLHGDLHPGNILVTNERLVAIDWFDVTIGHPLTDVLRTEVLLRPLPGDATPLHLPGGDARLLEELAARYADTFADMLDPRPAGWRSIVALCRLSEAAEVEPDELWQRWRERDVTVN